jgi:3-isopropylmalate dehydrogenase
MNTNDSQAPFRLTSLVSKRACLRLGTKLPLAILPGEGIGPELIEACQPILDAIENHTPHRFELDYGGSIGNEALRDHGDSLTEDVVAFCRRNFDRGAPLFCGPGGDRFVYKLRKVFDVYCKFVPLKPLTALQDCGAMRESAVRHVDVLLIRENVGGVYQGAWHLERTNLGRRAHHSFHYDETDVQRIMALATAAAGHRRGKLCVVNKPGGVPSISELWADIAGQCVAGSDVELRFLEVDTAAYMMLAEAGTFDVVVTPNLFGDVLADAAALLLGSRGMSFSYNVSGIGNAVYQTGHGAAYDLAGTGTANPLGQIQALAALLYESYGLFDLADALLEACNTTLASGRRTADIMGPGAQLLSTSEMGAAVADQLASDLTAGRCERASQLV